MIRARFLTDGNDCRPVVWPIKQPYWRTGLRDGQSVVVAYVDSEEEIFRLWPDAENVSFDDCDELITFCERFPKPDWYQG